MTTNAHGYGPDYYATHCGDTAYEGSEAVWQNHFRTFAATLVDRYHPKRVLDVGCAKGFLVQHLRDAGVEAYGIDTSEYAISQVRPDVAPFCKVASGCEPLDGRFDLITCIEVIEHLPEEEAERLIANLCAHTDEVIFSSTPSDFAEPTHVNVQPAEYWRERFARNGFHPDLRFEPGFITPHAMRFKRLTRPVRVVIFSKEREEWAVVRLRVLDPLRLLEKQGRMRVTFVSAYDEAFDVQALLDADVFVVQREFADATNSREIVEAARLLGKTVVFEIDDLLTAVPRSNPVYPYCTRIAQDMLDCMKRADFLTCSTQPLVDELSAEEPTLREKSYVLRNCVNPEIWGGGFTEREPREGEPLVVGWFGSPTHREDLAIVEHAIEYVVRKHSGKVEFHFFGYLPPELAGKPGVKLVRGGQADVVKHARGVREARIDLAIAPLTDVAFNRAKSDLKWLEYSICSIPGLYSRVAPYVDSITDGVTGIIVDNTTADWVAALERMIADRELRANIARNAFAEVRGNFCIDVADWRWDDLYRAFVVSGPREPATGDAEADATRAAALLFQMQARQQSRRGAITGAVRSFEASLALDGGNAEPAVLTAIQLANLGHFAPAERLLTSAVTRSPGSPEGWLWLSRFHRMTDDPVKAEFALRGGEQAVPGHLELAIAHVRHLRESGREGEVAARLQPLLAVEYTPDQAIAAAQQLVKIGRPHEALAIVRATSSRHPDTDFAPLTLALAKAAGAAEGSIGEWSPERHRNLGDALKIAVYCREPLSSARVHTRLRAPLRVLERAALATTRWSDGETHAGIVDWADLVVIHRSFCARDAAGPIVERARALGRRVVFEIDDLLFDRAEQQVGWLLSEADLVTVPTAALKDLLVEIAPDAAARIQVLEAAIDLETWNGRSWRAWDGERAFSIGLFTGWAEPRALKPFVAEISRFVEASQGGATLTMWAPLTDDAAALPRSSSIGAATHHYAEYAKALATRAVDVAIVPVGADARHRALSDSVFLELAASRIPGLFSRREPFAQTVLAGTTGFLIDDDPRSFVAGIEQLMQNPLLMKDVADRAWTIAMAERTIQARAIEWGRLYAELVGSPARETAAV